MWENSWSTVYLLGNIYVGSGKTQECGNHVDDIQMRQTDKSQWMMSQMRQTDESWWMMSQMSHMKQSHKSIAQLNHTG